MLKIFSSSAPLCMAVCTIERDDPNNFDLEVHILQQIYISETLCPSRTLNIGNLTYLERFELSHMHFPHHMDNSSSKVLRETKITPIHSRE